MSERAPITPEPAPGVSMRAANGTRKGFLASLPVELFGLVVTLGGFTAAITGGLTGNPDLALRGAGIIVAGTSVLVVNRLAKR